MSTVTARIERSPYETHLSTDTNVIVADEPEEVGGGNRGMKPGDLLAGALGACTVMTLRMYADRKGWPLDAAVAHVDWERDPDCGEAVDGPCSQFTVRLVLTGNLTDEQRDRLREIADRCPIHRTLEQPIVIKTTLSEP